MGANIFRAHCHAADRNEAGFIQSYTVNFNVARLALGPRNGDLFNHGDIVQIGPKRQLLIARQSADIELIGGCLQILAIVGEAADDFCIEEGKHNARPLQPVTRIASIAATRTKGLNFRSGRFAKGRPHRYDQIFHCIIPDRIIDPVLNRGFGRNEAHKLCRCLRGRLNRGLRNSLTLRDGSSARRKKSTG